jgi:Lrp/AsnC family transcriptional regulator for asnA, asnC and gidA
VSDITQQQDTVERLKEIPEIVECHYITGSYNLMVKIYCIDNEHLMRTIFDKILHVQGVSSTQTYMSLNESFQREIHVDCLDY